MKTAPEASVEAAISGVDRVRDLVVPCAARTRIVVLQHPQERDRELGTVPLLRAMIPSTELIVGLSWPSLARALGGEVVDNARWAVVFPGSLPRELTVDELAKPVVRLDRNGNDVPASPPLEGVIVIDGSWSQAKTLWWRNAWLLKSFRPGVR